MDIVELDLTDEAGLRGFWECEQASILADRPHAVSRSWAAIQVQASEASSRVERVFLAAREGDRTVGTAYLELMLSDNTHLAELEVDVHPEVRRRGIGTTLHASARERGAGRTTWLGEAHAPPHARGSAMPFAESLGYSSVHVEDHLVMALPATVLAPDVPGWSVATWWGPCPDQWRAPYLAMRSQMEQDVPIGDIDWEPQPYTEELLHEEERRLGRAHQMVTAVAVGGDGRLGGYSQLLVPHEVDYGWQADTLVMPPHRGFRLGLLMKAATLAELQRECPDRTALHTWTAVTNAPMQRTNAEFGYRPVERLHEMQRVDG